MVQPLICNSPVIFIPVAKRIPLLLQKNTHACFSKNMNYSQISNR